MSSEDNHTDSRQPVSAANGSLHRPSSAFWVVLLDGIKVAGVWARDEHKFVPPAEVKGWMSYTSRRAALSAANALARHRGGDVAVSHSATIWC
jgi:hypothetical protein